MRFYLGTPGNRLSAAAANGMPVLVSYAAAQKIGPWLMEEYAPSFERMLLDSGAFSEMNTGATVDLGAYRDWASAYPWVDAFAGLDDIQGDWRRSLKNYEEQPGAFPTIHDSDPPELLNELVALARERGRWLGLGLVPPRQRKEHWVRETLDAIPDDIHVHGWACGLYANLPRFDSIDSTNWFRDIAKVRNAFPWLTSAEALDIIVKRYQRVSRMSARDDAQPELFA